MPEDPLFELFHSASPREILHRIADGDPLEIAPRCAEYLREEAWLIDPERMALRSLACTAHAGVGYRGHQPLSDWLRVRFDDAAEQLLEDELDAVQSGLPLEREPEQHLVFLSQALGLELPIARRACAALNTLPRPVRRTVWAVLIGERTPDEIDVGARAPDGTAAAHLRLAVDAIREWTQIDGWSWKAGAP